MTTNTTRTSEQIERELEEAKEAERSLAEEVNRGKEGLRAAASEGKLDLQEAAIAGKSLKDASPLTKARRRAEELPALLWAAISKEAGAGARVPDPNDRRSRPGEEGGPRRGLRDRPKGPEAAGEPGGCPR
jgi:hypothetical protein